MPEMAAWKLIFVVFYFIIYIYIWNLQYFIKGIKLLGWEWRLLGFAFTCVAHYAWFDSTRLSLLMCVGSYVLFFSILVQ